MRLFWYWTEDGSGARCRIDQPTNQRKQKGNSGDGLRNTQAQVYLKRWEENSEPAALPFPPAGKVIFQKTQPTTLASFFSASFFLCF
jgi:hypothetical protein